MHNLRHQDVLLIGKHELIFNRSDLMNKKSRADEFDDDKTRILDTTQYKTLIHKEQQRATGQQEERGGPSFFKRITSWLFG